MYGIGRRVRRPYRRRNKHRRLAAVIPTLHIEHQVTDYTTWKGAFDRMAEFREKSGVLHHRVQRPVDGPGHVVIDLDFGTTSEAESFLDFLRTTVWSARENSPALVGTPQAKIFELVEGG
jgi:hypothetical protein